MTISFELTIYDERMGKAVFTNYIVGQVTHLFKRKVYFHVIMNNKSILPNNRSKSVFLCSEHSRVNVIT